MRIHMIACRVFTRELSYYAALCRNVIDITWLPQGLHDTPDLLRRSIADAIEDLQRQKEQNLLKHQPDAIALGYGLCSNGVIGLHSYDIPIIVPRTDDCIALFLGSQHRYLEYFYKYSGTYWLNNGWVETAFIPYSKMLENRKEEYAQRYGEDNAEYLMEQDMMWTGNYRYCGYISSPVYESEDSVALAKTVAQENHWEYLHFDGNTRMIRDLVDGRWGQKDFLVCPPHHRIEASFDETKLKAVPVEM